jgi:hypothetical protein
LLADLFVGPATLGRVHAASGRRVIQHVTLLRALLFDQPRVGIRGGEIASGLADVGIALQIVGRPGVSVSTPVEN